MEYGVNVTNKFAFLSGDEESNDPEELIAQAKESAKREKSALKKEAKKTPVVQEKKVTIQTNSVNKENVDVQRPPRRDHQAGGPRGQGFDRKGPRFPRRPEEVTNAASGDAMSDRFGESRPPRNFNSNRPPRDGGAPRFNNNNNGGDNNNRGPPRRFPRNEGGGGPRPPRFNRNENSGENNNVNNVSDDQTDGNQQSRPPARFRRGGASGPRGDRVSGSDKTGVRAVPKKDGHGRGNWGTETDELAGETENPDAVNQSQTNEHDDSGAAADGEQHAEADEAVVEPQPEPPRELTLEEWKAQHKSEQPQFNIRRPGEGDDKKLYQKLVPIKRATTATKDAKAAAAAAEEEEKRREPREKPLNIAVSFNDPLRNRGGPRGGGGGGYYRDRGDRSGDDRRGNNQDRERRPPPPNANFRNNNRGGAGGNQGGGGRRPPVQNFNLTPESFPALGAH